MGRHQLASSPEGQLESSICPTFRNPNLRNPSSRRSEATPPERRGHSPARSCPLLPGPGVRTTAAGAGPGAPVSTSPPALRPQGARSAPSPSRPSASGSLARPRPAGAAVPLPFGDAVQTSACYSQAAGRHTPTARSLRRCRRQGRGVHCRHSDGRQQVLRGACSDRTTPT